MIPRISFDPRPTCCSTGMAIRLLSGFALLLAVAPRLQAQIPCHYDVQATVEGPDCGFFQGSATPRALNSMSQIVGSSQCFTSTAFAWTPEDGHLSLPIPPYASESWANDISDTAALEIIGTIATSNGYRAYRVTGDCFEELATVPGGNWGVAYAISSDGIIAGLSGNISTADPPPQAVLWQSGQVQSLGADLEASSSLAYDINDVGQVTGYRREEVGAQPMAFVWQSGDFIDLGPIPGGISSQGRAVNNHGAVVGYGTMPEIVVRAFYWDGTMTDLGTLGEGHTRAYDLNDDGVVVGASAGEGFVWYAGVMRNLNDLIDPSTGAHIGAATAISENGLIVGYGSVGSSNAALLLEPAPLGDLDGDFTVNGSDVMMMLEVWGPCMEQHCCADINADGTIDAADLAVLLGNWSG